MWVQRAVCGLLAQNVGSLAVIVGSQARLLARNVSRKCPLFAGSGATVCKPLQLSQQSFLSSKILFACTRQQTVSFSNGTGPRRLWGANASPKTGEIIKEVYLKNDETPRKATQGLEQYFGALQWAASASGTRFPDTGGSVYRTTDTPRSILRCALNSLDNEV
jgi:hypothetical protein